MSENRSGCMLVVTPHPGDIELGIGGLVAKTTKEGKDVVFVVCTDASKGTSIVNMKPGVMSAVREKEQLDAASILGVREVVFLHHPDLGLENVPDLTREILALVLKYRPQVVVTCDPTLKYLSNPDHRAVGRAVIDAVWPFAMAVNAYPELREKDETHRVDEILLWQPAEPDYYYDITDTFETKLAAFKAHKTQAGDPMRPDFAKKFRDSAINDAKDRGYELGEKVHRIKIPEIL